MTIAEAAKVVLKDAGRPLSIDEIYQQIIERKLYSFGAKDPKAVLARTIREKSDQSARSKEVIFCMTSQGIYKLA